MTYEKLKQLTDAEKVLNNYWGLDWVLSPRNKSFSLTMALEDIKKLNPEDRKILEGEIEILRGNLHKMVNRMYKRKKAEFEKM